MHQEAGYAKGWGNICAMGFESDTCIVSMTVLKTKAVLKELNSF